MMGTLSFLILCPRSQMVRRTVATRGFSVQVGARTPIIKNKENIVCNGRIRTVMSDSKVIYRLAFQEQVDHTSYEYWHIYFLDEAAAKNSFWYKPERLSVMSIDEVENEMTVTAYKKLMKTGCAEMRID